MESPPKSIPRPFRSASLHPHDFPGDEVDSGVFQLSDSSVLLLMSPGPDVAPLVRAMEGEGFTVVPISDAAAAEASGYGPTTGDLGRSGDGLARLLTPHQRARHDLASDRRHRARRQRG